MRRCLKIASDGAAVTWADRSFHTATADTVRGDGRAACVGDQSKISAVVASEVRLEIII